MLKLYRIMVNRNILLFLSWLFSYGSYCCTEKTGCEQGKKLFRLICSHLNKNNECTIPIDQLESVSEEMKSLECDSFVNDFIKLKYAQYLCSSFDVQNGPESKVDIDHTDRVTTDYIKGLELYSQLLFSPIRKAVKKGDDFNKCLRRLKIDSKYFEHHIKELRQIVFNIQEIVPIDCPEINKTECLIPDKSFATKAYKNRAEMCVEILKFMYFQLKKLKNENIIDGFIQDQFNFLNKYNSGSFITEAIVELHEKSESISDYMKYLYSITLFNKNTSFMKESYFLRGSKTQYNKKGKSKAICSRDSLNYLLHRINSGTPFKSKYLEYLIYYSVGATHKFFKEYKESIPYYEHGLACVYDIQLAIKLSKNYFKINDYRQALIIFKQAKNYAKLSDKEKKTLKSNDQYYLSLLEITNHKDEYDKVSAEHMQEILENRLKNNSGFVKKAKKTFNLIVQKEQNRLEQEANQKRILSSKPQIKEQDKQETDYSFTGPLLENQKKHYTTTSSKKKKTRGIAAPVPMLEGPVLAVEAPVVPIEDKIENNPYKILCRLFGPYEKSPIMDKHIKLHPDELETLFKALKFPFSRSDGKGSHMKATLLSNNDNNEPSEQTMVIPYRNDIGPHYIRSLRESLIKMDLYPEDLKETLQNKGLIK